MYFSIWFTGEHIGKLCSGHGECSCGECKCFETDEGQYSGRYCEDCPVSWKKKYRYKYCSAMLWKLL